jgi:histidinol-phosphate phosphatase family protein
VTTRAAVFLDRDGTIIDDRHYLADPDQVRLLPGAAAAIRRLNERDVAVVLVTNQSGIARGLLSEGDYRRVHARMEELLAAERARIDATYLCPHHPDFTGACDCRKPGTLLFRRAATDLTLDLTRSWFIGDKLRDIIPASTLGGQGVLVPSGETSAADVDRARAEYAVARSLDEAVGAIIESAR